MSASAVIDIAAPPDGASGPTGPVAPGRPRPRPVAATVLVALVSVGAALAYALIQRHLAIQHWRAVTARSPYAGTLHPFRDSIEFSLGPFLAVMVGSVSLVALRHRVAAFGIFVLLACAPVLQWALGDLPTDRGVLFRVGPNALGAEWFGRTIPSLVDVWRAFAVDHALAFLPAAILAWAISRADPRRPDSNRRAPGWLRRPSTGEIAGALCAVFVFWLVLHTHELIETNGPKTSTDVIAFGPFFVLGAVLSRGRAWRFVPLVAIPILWSTTWLPQALAFGIHTLHLHDMREDVAFVAPLLWIIAAGTLWYPVAALVDRVNREQGRHVVALVVALNVLNVADAVFTVLAVHSGQAIEANPVAAGIGPGVKVIVVGAASVFLARHRPRVLVWLVLALLAVVAWHVSGFILDTPGL